jgi:hypothetical protein
MITIKSVPSPEEYRIQVRYSRPSGQAQDRWEYCESYASSGEAETLLEILPFLREREKGMDFRVVKVTTAIEPVEEPVTRTHHAARGER